MSFRKELAVSRAPISALAAVGVFWGGFAAYVPDVKAAIGADDSTWGMVMILSALGSFVSLYLAPRILARLGRRMLPLAGILLAGAAILPALPQSATMVGAALFAMGVTVAMLDMAANVRISVLEERHGLHLMNLNHAMFSFAFAGAALGVSLLRQAGWTPAQIVPFMALACLLLVLPMIEGRDWEGGPESGHGGRAGVSPWAMILPAAAILFAAFVCENATEVWSALHIERTLGGAHGAGGFGPMMLGLTMGIGRLSGQFAATRMGEANLVMGSSLVGVFGALVLALAPSPAVAYLGVGLLGLGVAVVVPSANSILGRLVAPELRGYAISRAWMVGFAGFFLGPTIIGIVSDVTSLRWAFGFIALVMASIIPAVRLLQRRGG